MRIEGDHKFDAPRDLVWSLLNDSATMRRAIPGCEHFHLHADGKYHIDVNVKAGPFGGFYEGLITPLGEQPQESIALSITASGPETILSGEGALTLKEDQGKTILHYAGDVDVSGQVPMQSPRLVRTTANAYVRSFLEAIEYEIDLLTGVPGSNGQAVGDQLPVERQTPTLTMQDFITELRRDRWVALVILVATVLATLSGLGLVFLVLLIMRWAGRSAAGRVLPGRRREEISDGEG